MSNLKPGTINGHEVIALAALPRAEGCREGRVILVDRGGPTTVLGQDGELVVRSQPYVDRYVVSRHYEVDDSWESGTYCTSLAEAWKVFLEKLDTNGVFDGVEIKFESRAAITDAANVVKYDKLSLDERDMLHRGFDAGNYANAYVTENLERAWKNEEASEDSDTPLDTNGPYYAGFVLGFFSSYEDHEIGDSEERELRASMLAKWGPACRAAGIAVD